MSPAHSSLSTRPGAASGDFIPGWYAILSSRELRGSKAMTCERFGLPLLIKRTPNDVHVWHDRCPHRGVRLSKGTQTDTCLTCPFHGLQFDLAGRCITIPVQNPSDTIPRAMHLHTFVAREAHGFIFMWWGPQPEQLPPIDWFHEALHDCHGPNERWADSDVGLSRNIENQLDAAHLPFVHARTIGRLVKSPQMDVQSSVDGQRIRMSQAGKTNTWVEMRLPNLWLNCIGSRAFVMLAFAPVSANRTRIYTRYYQGFMAVPGLRGLFGWIMGWANLWILREDLDIIASHDTAVSPALDGTELLLVCDTAIVQYRRLRQSLNPSVKTEDTNPA